MPRFLTISLLIFAFTLGTLAFFTPSTYSNTEPTPGAFVTTWNTENPGTSNEDQITIPGTGAGYSYSIYWESLSDPGINGTTSTSTASSYTLTFPEPGQYRVDIIGDFPRIYFNNGGDRQKILTVEQWGDNAWASMERAFWGATNLRVPATDAPDLSGVTILRFMFRGATSFNDPIGHWDVSNVVNMNSVFNSAMNFNQPLNNWNVSNVEDVSGMFDGWDIRDIGRMSFNQPLDQWDVGNVTNMQSMFRVTDFNQNINNWDVRNVVFMNFMFHSALEFNQPLDNWETESLQQMSNIFSGATKFNQPVNSWDTSNVTHIAGAFRNTSFDHPLDQWDVSNIVSFNNLFTNAPFNQDISMWNTANAVSMRETFLGATSFDHSLASWDVRNVTTMENMFQNSGLSQPNLDALLTSFASQAATDDIQDIPLHIGAKTYSQSGAAALATLRDTYNWDITEQYLLTYDVGQNAILTGNSLQQLDSGADGTEVTVVPASGYQFIAWSDGATSPTRTDTAITDNRTLTAQIEAIPSPRRGTSAARQAQNLESIGKTEEAAALCKQFPSACPTTTAASTTGSSTQVLISLVKPEYRAIMAALLQVFGW